MRLAPHAANVGALINKVGLTSPVRLRKEDRRSVVEEKAIGPADGGDDAGGVSGSGSGAADGDAGRQWQCSLRPDCYTGRGRQRADKQERYVLRRLAILLMALLVMLA